MITYAILVPGDKPVGYIRSAENPTPEEMADHLATLGQFEDRDHFLKSNPGLVLGFAPLH